MPGADTWRTKFGDAAIAETRRTQGRRKADTWRTRGGQGLDARPKRTQGKHEADAEADKLRGRGQSISRPAFFSKRGPQSKLFGEELFRVYAYRTSLM